jgi:hypothetical protein
VVARPAAGRAVCRGTLDHRWSLGRRLPWGDWAGKARGPSRTPAAINGWLVSEVGGCLLPGGIPALGIRAAAPSCLGHRARAPPPHHRPQRPYVVPLESPGCRAARHRVEGNSSCAKPPPRGWGVGSGLVVASLSSGLRIWICQVPRRSSPQRARPGGAGWGARQRRPDWPLKTSRVVLLPSRTRNRVVEIRHEHRHRH